MHIFKPPCRLYSQPIIPFTLHCSNNTRWPVYDLVPRCVILSIIVTDLAQYILLEFCAPTKPGDLYRSHCFSLSNVDPSYIHSLSYPPALHSSHDLLRTHILLFCLSILLTFPAHRNVQFTTLTTPGDLFIYHKVLRYVIFILATYPSHRIFLRLTTETRTTGVYKPRSSSVCANSNVYFSVSAL